MKIAYALFDMDGTLLDSMGFWRELEHNFLLARGVKDIPADLPRRTAALTLAQCAAYLSREFCPALTPETIVAELTETVARFYREQAQPKPCALAYLRQLKAAGARLCVVTATDAPLAEPALQRTGLRDCLEFVLCCEEAGLPKTTPAIFDLAARRLGTTPGQAVVFEDALHCIRAARAGGYPVVAVEEPTAAADRPEIRRLCQRYITSYAQLLPLAAELPLPGEA